MFEKLTKKFESQRLGSAFAVLLAVFAGISVIAMSGERQKADPVFVTSEIGFEEPICADGAGLMLKGYDPVAYFMDGRARRGSAAFAAQWDDIVFHFVSEDNRDAFLTDPTRYLPQFGGYDAEGVRLGVLRRADPTAFLIVDDKLYLLENARTQQEWSDDRALNAAVADRIWPRLLTLREGDAEIADLSTPGAPQLDRTNSYAISTATTHFSRSF